MKSAARRACVLVAALLLPAQVAAQEPGAAGDGCAFLCAPEIKIEPQVAFGPIFTRPTLERLENGEVVGREQPETDAGFETVLAIGIPTEIPRVEFTLETVFVPFENTDNDVEVELELNLVLLEPEETGGWLGSHFDIVDKFSPAERPTDTSRYTHKLNFEWDTALYVFNWLSEGSWLRNVEIEGSLDYVATGLARAGDVIGDTRLLDDDSPWSFSLVFIFPLAPLSP